MPPRSTIHQIGARSAWRRLTRRRSRVVSLPVVAMFALLVAAGCGGLQPVPLFEGDPDTLPEGVIEEKTCVDFWAAVHIASGYYLGELGEDSFIDALLWLALYEVAEPQFWPRWGENQLNQQCDIVFGGLGWLTWYATDGE